MPGNDELNHIVSIYEPEGQQSHLGQRKRFPIGIFQPWNVPLCTDKLLQTKGKRVSPDDIVPGPSVQGKVQTFLDCVIRDDGS